MFFFQNDGTLCHNNVSGRKISRAKSKDDIFLSNNINCPDYQDMVHELQWHILSITMNLDFESMEE